MTYKSKTWKNVSIEKQEDLKNFLLSNGATFDEGVTEPELWRGRLQDTVFTMYSKGTLYSNAASNEFVFNIQKQISEILGQTIEIPEKEFLIGLDETGKGEVLGHSILAGVLIPNNMLQKINELLGTADTKKKKSTAYWDNLFIETNALKSLGVNEMIEKIPTWHVDTYNTNKIMDLVYQRIISHLIQEISLDNCRIIIDDYGIGKNLSDYLESLHKRGCEIRVESKADDKYDECRLASVIAKRERTRVMDAISKRFSLKGFPMGSGNAGDVKTISWLKEYWKQYHDWPWFVKKSFSTIREIDGTAKVNKIDPPLRHELLSRESQTQFREGKLSISSLSISCPHCGETMRSCKVTLSTTGIPYIGRCIKCNEIIENLNTTLLYYCGYIVIDSNIIFEKILHKDLEVGKFFEGFTILLHPAVHKECDSENGRKELEELARFSSLGRIRLQEISNVGNYSDADESIVESARKNNAILYTRDKRMHAVAAAKNVFFLV